MLVCVSCASPEIEPVDYYGPTGVTAPDGGMEMAGGTLWKCRECGDTHDEVAALVETVAVDFEIFAAEHAASFSGEVRA